ncbi:MAG: N-acetyltransferase [Pseudomonadota bacterium]|nr:N-acetyltransferase [Pseudomonadota bacterium]
MNELTIRAETPEDVGAIHAVVEAAFANVSYSDQREAQIVWQLREADALAVSLVADRHGELLGHVAASPVQLSDGSDHWFGIGPVSVLPDWQGQGIGTALMEAVIATLREQGAAGCVLLGDPSWYLRFGFVATPLLRLPGVPPEYFQALLLRGDWPDAEVHYPSAFAG